MMQYLVINELLLLMEMENNYRARRPLLRANKLTIINCVTIPRDELSEVRLIN